ncbi:orotate phosphoribosyltransferase [Knoellia locipacati]|uniref:Orotate phosphoribosyltransferase n=1 Tax=Knoellia locipacati TaxID=882824 RepID=A0A512SY32_9MICO|nr:orotate phosphoribosyltransferase [Knoellia locipacati]
MNGSDGTAYREWHGDPAETHRSSQSFAPRVGSLGAVTDIAADRARLLEIIKDKAIVHGRVTLSSGKEADYYVDLRRITLDGEASPLVGRVMRDLAADLEFDAVGGLTLGADPVATSMLHAAAAAGERLDAFVVRKAGKAHGLQQRIEGPSIEGRRVLIVEDTSTTGASPLDAAKAAQEAGATVVGVATIADRATGAAQVFAGAGLGYRHAFGLEDLGLA